MSYRFDDYLGASSDDWFAEDELLQTLLDHQELGWRDRRESLHDVGAYAATDMNRLPRLVATLTGGPSLQWQQRFSHLPS